MALDSHVYHVAASWTAGAPIRDAPPAIAVVFHSMPFPNFSSKVTRRQACQQEKRDLFNLFYRGGAPVYGTAPRPQWLQGQQRPLNRGVPVLRGSASEIREKTRDNWAIICNLAG